MFTSYFKSTILPNSSIVLAFSGGLDSTVLLHQLICWKKFHPTIILRVLHVNHKLSPNSDNWALHCMSICNKWKIPCNILNIKFCNNYQHRNIESEARKERYKILKMNLKKDEILLTAHHLNDQCETLLLALKRGSGPLGLASMPKKLNLGNNNYLIRPFLSISRSQLEKYAKNNYLFWIEDESNINTKYDRNFLRKLLLIILKRWPYFANTVSRSAQLCGEQEKLIDELLDSQLKSIVSPDGGLIFTTFLTMSTIRKHALLRRWIASHNYIMPSRAMLSKIINEVILSKKDAKPCLKINNYNVRRFRQKIYLLSNNYSSLKNEILFWKDINQILILPDNLGYLKGKINKFVLRLPKNNEVVSVKFQSKGHVNLFNRSNKKKINLLWKELNIPPWQRERIPLIYYNNILITSPGIFITNEGIVDNDNKKGWEIFWNKL